MLFIILTLSIGIFNANAARTLNNNIEEKIRYSIGADLNIMAHWESNEVPTASSSMGGGPPESQILESLSQEPVQYREPPVPFTELSGADKVTKVFRQDDITVQLSTRDIIKRKTELLGIIPNEFEADRLV